jgi:hypothetical protein
VTRKSSEELLREANVGKTDLVKCLKESIDYRSHMIWQAIYDLSLEELSIYRDFPEVPALIVTLKHFKSLVQRLNPYLLEDDCEWKMRELLGRIDLVILRFEIASSRKRLEHLL